MPKFICAVIITVIVDVVAATGDGSDCIAATGTLNVAKSVGSFSLFVVHSNMVCERVCILLSVVCVCLPTVPAIATETQT